MIKLNPLHESITRRYIAPLVRILVLAVFLVTALQGSADARNMQRLTIVNNTDRYFSRVYIGGGDCLHGAGLAGGGNSHTIMYNADIRYWDVTITLENGSSLGYNCDLSGASRLIFFKQGSQILVTKR